MSAPALLAATLALPLALALACVSRAVRARMLSLLWLAPLPGLVAALGAVDGAPLVVGGAGLRLTFALDFPGAMLLGVAALLWSGAGAYAASYLRGAPDVGRFAVCWLLALTGCLGAFFVADLVGFYLMLALLTLGAAGLVIQDGTPRAWRSGIVYLTLALTGEAAVLLGFVLLAVNAPGDSLLIRDVMAALPDSPWRAPTLWLIVLGFGLKAGLFPLHVWMPLAHAAAPVPASAVLSGAVVKVGIIGLIRFLPSDLALPGWGELLAAAGLFTAFYGVAIGILQRHPKAVLAYSSVSQMGLVVAVLGMSLAAGRSMAPLAAAFYASHHVLVKGALFLAVGVAAASGTQILRWVLVPAAVLALALGGLPLTGGAVTKYAIKGPLGDGLAGTLSLASAAGTTLLMLHFLVCLKAHGAQDPAARAGIGLKAPWLLLAVAALAVPWALYLGIAVPRGLLPSVMTPAAVWAALWPVLVGVALAAALWRWGARLPRVPEGDIAAVIEPLTRAAPGWGRAFERADAVLRRWPVAGVALLLVVLGTGALLWTGT